MKAKTILILGLSLLAFSSCQKESGNNNENITGYMSVGKITGPDMRMCPSPCCGGWFIQINDTFYEFDALPANSDIDLNKVTFPVNVKLDWQLNNEPPCPDTRIEILRIKKL